MIIDCHVHLNNYHEQIAVSLDESLDKLQASMAEAGIDYALVLTSYIVSPHRPSAAEVIKAIEKVPNLGVVAGISFLQYRERQLRELADFLRAGLVKGLKLYPGYEPFYPHDSRLRVVYDLAEEFDVPVMIHSGDTYSPKGKVKYSRPIEVDEVAVDEAFEDYMQEQIEDVILYAGEPAYLLFGTDWPICDMKSYVKFVQELKMPEPHRRMLLYENTRRLFKLPLPPDPDLAGESGAPRG